MAEAAEWAVGTRRRRQQTRILIAAAVIVVVIVYLVISSAKGATQYSLTIGELQAKGQTAIGQGARVSGLLDGNSISWDAQNLVLRFLLTGQGSTLPVVYKGIKPDMFRDGAEVIVEGKLGADGTFEAKTLLLKCPSKYASGTAVYETQPTPGS